MRRLIISLLLLIGQLSYGQTTDSITKIIFTYSKGHNSWDDPGIYGRSEQIEFSPSGKENFKLTKYFKVDYSAGVDGKTFTKDTIQISTKKYSEINRLYFQNWLTQLNTQKENFTEAFIKPKLTQPNKKEISAVAKSLDKELFFDKDFSEERKEVTKKIQSFYRLDSFLILTRPNIEYLMVVIDNWNRLRIEVIKQSDTTIYQCQFFVPLGQPVYRYDHKDFSNEKRVFNLEINSCAQKFLPKKSLIYKILDIDNIKERYIKWCLEKYF